MFQKHTNSAIKNVRKKSSEKRAKKRVLFSHEYHYKHCGGKNARNNFFRNTLIVRAKNVGKNRLEKCNKRFLYSHEYRDPKGGETRETRFPEKHE